MIVFSFDVIAGILMFPYKRIFLKINIFWNTNMAATAFVTRVQQDRVKALYTDMTTIFSDNLI